MEQYSEVKKLKRKISLSAIIIALLLCVAGCGVKKQATLVYQEETLQQNIEMVINSFSQMQEADFDAFINGSDLQVNLQLMQSNIPAERDAFVSMIEAWKAGTKECGAYISHETYKFTPQTDEVIVSTVATFESRNAELEFVFDKNLNFDTMTISGDYTKGEILKKAGQNTLLGMGTVFSVLIFIAFIISLMKYIPGIIDRLSGKKSKTEISPVVATNRVIIEEDFTDDMELVAVITAAIAADMKQSTDDFIVRAIKRKTSNKWR